MIISIVAAVDQRGGIGRENRLPWHLSDDLKHFRRLTMGHHVLLGRKTYESSAGKMPGRKLILLSKTRVQPEDAQLAKTFEEGLDIARKADEEELFVIGGAQVFAQALPIAQRFYLTQVHADSRADVFFPTYDPNDWKIVSRQEFSAGPKNDHPFTILKMEKVQK